MQRRSLLYFDTLERGNHPAARDHQMDNIRFLLIFFVVFGHLIETFRGNGLSMNIRRCIYTFHMPVFLFISGYFARYKPKGLVRRLLCPYILFQFLYLAFEFYILRIRDSINLQFTNPFWLLWFLLALFFYNILLPLFQTDDWRAALRNLIICVLLALAVGFDNSIGYYLSLSRIFVFLPFFVAGQYCAVFSIRSIIDRHRRIAAVGAGVAIAALEALFICLKTPVSVFYGSLSYHSLNSNILIRLLFIICAFAWCVLFLSAVPKKELRIITGIGQRTLPVFLLHGFFQRTIKTLGLLRGGPYKNLLYAGGISVLLLLLLSVQPLYKIFRKLFRQAETLRQSGVEKPDVQ